MRYLCFFIILLFVVACNQETEEEKILKEFMVFYDQFHQDPIFQKEHINFPLEGIPPTGQDSLINDDGTFFWQEEEWKIHKPVDFTQGEFSRAFSVFDEQLITEKITHSSGMYGILRRFAKIDEEWTLIYYIAPNKLKQPEIFIN